MTNPAASPAAHDPSSPAAHDPSSPAALAAMAAEESELVKLAVDRAAEHGSSVESELALLAQIFCCNRFAPGKYPKTWEECVDAVNASTR